jgi:hypothetical protein
MYNIIRIEFEGMLYSASTFSIILNVVPTKCMLPVINTCTSSPLIDSGSPLICSKASSMVGQTLIVGFEPASSLHFSANCFCNVSSEIAVPSWALLTKSVKIYKRDDQRKSSQAILPFLEASEDFLFVGQNTT